MESLTCHWFHPFDIKICSEGYFFPQIIFKSSACLAKTLFLDQVDKNFLSGKEYKIFEKQQKTKAMEIW